MLVLAIAFAAGPVVAADQTLELAVTINGASTGKIGEFFLRDGVLLAQAEELGELGLRVAKTAPRTPDGLVVVSGLPGVSFSLDPLAQTLQLNAGSDQLVATVLGATPPKGAAPLESGTGATLNYEVADSFAEGRHQASGQFDLRLFSPWGVASTDFLAHAGSDPSTPGQSDAIRLDSTYVFSDFPGQRRLGWATSSLAASPGRAPSASAASRSATTSRCGRTWSPSRFHWSRGPRPFRPRWTC